VAATVRYIPACLFGLWTLFAAEFRGFRAGDFAGGGSRSYGRLQGEMPEQPPLIQNIERQFVENVRILLDNGADPDVRGVDIAGGWPAIAIALKKPVGPVYLPERNRPSACIARASTPAWRRPEHPLVNDDERPGCTDANGSTPLMYVAARGLEDLLPLLIEHGANRRSGIGAVSRRRIIGA
jgi:hypothetical protein